MVGPSGCDRRAFGTGRLGGAGLVAVDRDSGMGRLMRIDPDSDIHGNSPSWLMVKPRWALLIRADVFAPLSSHTPARHRPAGNSLESQPQKGGRHLKSPPTGCLRSYEPTQPPPQSLIRHIIIPAMKTFDPGSSRVPQRSHSDTSVSKSLCRSLSRDPQGNLKNVRIGSASRHNCAPNVVAQMVERPEACRLA